MGADFMCNKLICRIYLINGILLTCSFTTKLVIIISYQTSVSLIFFIENALKIELNVGLVYL